ncbi:MAG: TraQ conjugal transfer family protein [Odoribacter sp.]
MKILIIILIGIFLSSCNNNLDIKQDYSYCIKTLPIPKKLRSGETTAIEFTIVREGQYKNATYSFRYFQLDGIGTLTDDAGNPYPMNRFHAITNDEFTVLYQSNCKDAQTLDFVFQDNFGREVEYSVSFQNESQEVG